MRIYAFADTHGQHKSITIPECDTLIFAGDANLTTLQSSLNFLDWFKSRDCSNKILVCGNHDWAAEDHSLLFRGLCEERNIIYLEHEAVEIDGVKFFGSPYTPQFYDWAFMKEQHELHDLWGQIPDNTQVLITHGPSYGILDKCPDSVGCEELYYKIRELEDKKLAHHIFGHIHEGAGRSRIGNIHYKNVSVLDGKYKRNDVEDICRIIEI